MAAAAAPNAAALPAAAPPAAAPPGADAPKVRGRMVGPAPAGGLVRIPPPGLPVIAAFRSGESPRCARTSGDVDGCDER